VLIGGIEVLGLVGDRFELSGGFWNAIDGLNDNFNALGFVIIGIFIAAWIGSLLVYRCSGLDEAEVTRSGGQNVLQTLARSVARAATPEAAREGLWLLLEHLSDVREEVADLSP
jgi:High-affinity nickel-transport protein